jgi:hypothetical protein
MRPRFAWGIVLAGTLLGVGGGCLLAVFPRGDRVVVAETIEPPPGYSKAEPISINLDDPLGKGEMLGAWRRNPDDGFMALRFDAPKLTGPLDDRFGNRLAHEFLMKLRADDLERSSRVDTIAGRRVVRVDIGLHGSVSGKVQVSGAAMLIGGRVLLLVAVHQPDQPTEFDRVVDATAQLSDKSPVDRAALWRNAGLGAVAIAFPALMIAVFVTQRRRDRWQRAHTRESVKAAAS